MLDSRKRPAAYNPEFWGSKRRKTSSVSSDQELIASPSPPSPGSVVALLALTDPSIVTRVMHFIPHSGPRKRGEATCVMGTLVSLCRAVAPFDRSLPRHFGPANQQFWQDMVLRYFDFTTRGATGETAGATEQTRLDDTPPRLAVWTQLGVTYVPSEYGFLQQLQFASNQGDGVSWPRRENAFTLFCDLTVLVDKMRGFAKTRPSNNVAQRFLPCLRRPGAIDATTERPAVLNPTQRGSGMRSVPFLSRIRRSRREMFVHVISRQLQSWTHFRDQPETGSDSDRIDFYAGQSRRSNRWIGLTSVRSRPAESSYRFHVEK